MKLLHSLTVYGEGLFAMCICTWNSNRCFHRYIHRRTRGVARAQGCEHHHWPRPIIARLIKYVSSVLRRIAHARAKLLLYRLPWTIHALDLSYITTTFYEVHTYSGSRETTVSVSYSVSTGMLVLLENTVVAALHNSFLSSTHGPFWCYDFNS